MSNTHENPLRIGWASADLTPDQPVALCGQFHARVSEGIWDPIHATALAIESTSADGQPVRCVMVACDTAVISDELDAAVRERLTRALPEFDLDGLILNATHTHCAPEIRGLIEFGVGADCGVELDGVMAPRDYVALAADRIARAIADAWRGRAPAGIGFGLGCAAVGYNRRVCFHNGQTQMYGGVDRPEFSHLEAGTDHSVSVMGVYDQKRRLTGVVVNLACPSQVSEGAYQVSADFWHETRAALRSRFGQGLFVLPQVSAAGDLSPARRTITPDFKALERAWRLRGLDQRQHIAEQITSAVADALRTAERALDFSPQTTYRAETVRLPTYAITEQDVRDAQAQAETFKQQYEAERRRLDADPDARRQPRWYVNVTRDYRRMLWHAQVVQRHEKQKRQPWLDTRCHVLRLGEGVFATNRFEYYLDFGLQIKARSRAAQTFVVQLAGPGGYLPTARALAGKSYGAVPASIIVGPEGGQQLAEWTIAAINEMYPDPAATPVPTSAR